MHVSCSISHGMHVNHMSPGSTRIIFTVWYNAMWYKAKKAFGYRGKRKLCFAPYNFPFRSIIILGWTKMAPLGPPEHPEKDHIFSIFPNQGRDQPISQYKSSILLMPHSGPILSERAPCIQTHVQVRILEETWWNIIVWVFYGGRCSVVDGAMSPVFSCRPLDHALVQNLL